MKLALGLVLHNHQPVGNYGFVIDAVYRAAYAPMLEALERHPGVRVAMHHSGPLLEWLEANQPEYLDRFAALCARGQVEALSGGYYEPILPMIDDADKVGQIKKLSAYVERRFGQRPRGAWLTERIWEPGLPSPLSDAGVEWTLVDDAHFMMAGVPGEQLDSYFITEDQGRRLNLFAGSQQLRYAIPWMNVDELIASLRDRAAAAGDHVPYLVLGDDGEKFGSWPTTYAHVWEQGWIEEFFSALEHESAWLEMISPGDYAAAHAARGLVYLPAASYAEMMEWALPPDAALSYGRVVRQLEHDGRPDVARFLRGGFWREFIARYPEINSMHKRGARIARKLAGEAGPARDALWAAQCNCPYWHGVFGGLYLRHIRAATLANLVRAERLADEARGHAGVTIETRDYDFDGADDVLVQTPLVSVLIQPSRGGAVTEFDLRARDHASLGVVARWREAYHQALIDGDVSEVDAEQATNIHGGVRVKQSGLADALTFDAHRRAGAQDWIVAEPVSVEAFAAGHCDPLWSPDGAWAFETSATSAGATVRMTRVHDGWRIEKTIVVPPAGESLEVRYSCANVATERRTGRLLSEWNLSPPHLPEGDDRIATIVFDSGAARSPDRAGADATATAGSAAGVRRFTLHGTAAYALRCTVNGDGCDAWYYPVMTVSSSEGGLERTFQGVAVAVAAWLDLEAGGSVTFDYRWEVVGA